MKLYDTTVSAEKAREWLKLNLQYNRVINPQDVQKFARDMASGDWVLNGDTIKFDSNGVMFDGQQRLSAVILAQESTPERLEIPFCVAEGADPTAYMVTDIGRKRNASTQAHALTKGAYSGKSMPMVRWYWQYRMNNPMGNSGRYSAVPTRAQELQLFASDPNGFENSWERGRDLQKRKIGACRTGALFHHLLVKTEQVGQFGADNFFDSLVSGANLPEESPIKMLRDRLMSNRRSHEQERLKPYSQPEQLYLYHRAWRAYGRDETLTSLVLPSAIGKISNATFPKLWYPGVVDGPGVNPKTGNRSLTFTSKSQREKGK